MKGTLMRRTGFLGLLAVCLGLGGAIHAVEGQSTTRTTSTPELQLTTEVVSAEFCESDYLRLQLRLRYFNNSNQPIILSRQSNTIVTYFVSKTVQDAQREKYEQKYSPQQAPVGSPENFDTEAPDEQTFIILKPAAFYEVMTQAHLPFIYDGKDQDSDLLRPGHHVIQLRIQTWPGRPDLTKALRERWRAHGYLWSHAVITRPMIFSITNRPQIVQCSK